METHYEEVSQSDVLTYYAKDFDLPSGKRLFASEPFVDLCKGVVVFKLMVYDRT